MASGRQHGIRQHRMRTVRLPMLWLVPMLAGCAGFRAHYQPLITPEADVFAMYCPGPPTPELTDMKALCWVSTLVTQIRARETFTRNGKETIDATQVLLSGAAAALTAMAPAAQVAAVALGMASTVTPQVGGALGISEKADAYSAGLGLILDAEGAFLMAVATHGGVISDTILTEYGAQMIVATLGATQLTDKRITQQIVTIPDIQRAVAPTTAIVLPAPIPAAGPPSVVISPSTVTTKPAGTP